MFGAHEKEYLDYVLKFINRDSIVLDIGANYGNHSLGFAQKAQKVFAFEPDPWAYSKLKKIIQKNEIDNIYAFNFGLGESNENRLFYTANSNFNRGQSSFKNVLGTDLTPITSRVMPGDKFIKNHNILKIDFIKIDTEGYEYEVLKGLKSSIERFSPLILLEYNKEHLSELNEFLYHHKIYKPFLISINRSRFIFNQPHGIETTFNTNINRGEVLLIPRDLVCK
jgi:FkbM family methyltransferase